LGTIVEQADVIPLFKNPLHPYTRGLLKSLPNYKKDQKKSPLATIPGTVPNALNLSSGCKFFNRCSFAKEIICNKKEPELIELDSGHWVRCANMDAARNQ
jgi:oligopeptide/dipeptide ABC transporter ATP-binding protein